MERKKLFSGFKMDQVACTACSFACVIICTICLVGTITMRYLFDSVTQTASEQANSIIAMAAELEDTASVSDEATIPDEEVIPQPVEISKPEQMPIDYEGVYPLPTDAQLYRYASTPNLSGEYVATLYFKTGRSVDVYQYTGGPSDGYATPHMSDLMISGENSAVFTQSDNTGLIGDLSYQGFAYLYDINYGETVDLCFSDGSYRTFKCIGVDMNGTVDNKGIVSDGEGTKYTESEDNLWLYTFNHAEMDSSSVTVVKFTET